MDYTNGYLNARNLADQISATTRSGRSVRGLGSSRAQKKSVDIESAETDGELFAPLSVGSVSSFFDSPSEDNMKDYLMKLYGDEDSEDTAEESVETSGETRPMSRGDMLTSEIGKNLMLDLQDAYGLTREQAAGFVGNLAHETGDFKFMQEIEPLVKGSRGGWGFAQWTGPRRKNFENWVEENGLDPSSYEANLGFLMYEIDNTPEGAFMDDLKKAESVDEAVSIVSDKYLRPSKKHANMGSRTSRAYGYMEL